MRMDISKKIEDNAGVTGAVPPVESAAPAAPKSRRSGVLERLRKNHPDATFKDDDDEAVFGQIDDDFNAMDGELKEHRERDAKISGALRNDPRHALYLSRTLVDGENPITVLLEQYGDELRDALDDPEKAEELAKKHEEYVQKIADEEKWRSNVQENLKTSLEGIGSLIDEGYSEEQVDAALEKVASIMEGGLEGKYSVDDVRVVLKGLGYDGDVAQASHVGEVRGRNARINEKLRRGSRGDGLANLEGTNNRESGVLRPNPDLGALGTMGTSGDIWSRGGEKRVKNS